MPDYTSILRRSVSALPDSSPEMREAVYQRARAALARQLTAVDPPLSAREIERQHQELEDAVARIEADFAPGMDEEPDRFADSTGPEPERTFARPAPNLPAAPSPRADPSVRRPHAAAVPPDEADDEDGEDDEDYEDERRSRLPLVAGLLALVLVVGGAAAYGFAERESLLSFFGLGGAEQDVATAEPDPDPIAAAPEPGDGEPEKRPDRLTNGAEPPIEEPAAAAPPPAAAAEPEAAPAPTPPEPAAPPAVAQAEPPVALPPGEAPAEALPAESPPGLQEPSTAALEPPGESIVSQRAIYYFQGKEGSPGRAVQGTVNWAQITRDNSPAVQATLQLEEQNVTTTVTIYKNSDSTLPASHLVEVQFSGELAPSPIQRVPALVLKQTEQARGQPLAGAAVPVTDALFWIALSDDEEQIARNLQLLREGSWFDIPILFNDGTRALLTFEKGIPGERVFETVLSAWTPA